jgi:prepilin-type N-terminal cleavage/methylation domain-containing protein
MTRRQGMTLIELLVVVGIIGLLVAIVIPAVQSAREASRRVACLNNLRQIGLAMNSYAGREGVFPTAMMPGRGRKYSIYSAFVRILPELEQPVLMNSVNFEQPQSISVCPENQTASSTVLSVFLCPSDGAGTRVGDGPINYRLNMGSGPRSLSIEMPGEAGPFEALVSIAPGAITDGLSNTALVAEKSRGGGRPSAWDARRDYWFADRTRNPPLTTPEAIAICESLSPNSVPPHNAWAGSSWMLDGYGQTNYNHALTPNSMIPDCTDHGSDRGTDDSPGSGVFAARSQHGPGIHFLTADGAAHWVGSSISPRVWSAIGTRAGHETFNSPF